MKSTPITTALCSSLLALASLAPVAGQASDALEADSGELELVSEMTADKDASKRQTQMEIGFRGKYQTMPDAIIDIWFHRPGKDVGLNIPRPKVRAYGVGLEFVIKQKPTDERKGVSNGIFYFDYFGNLTEEGYWDDVEDEGGPVYDNGDYVVPSKDLSFLVLGADYAYEMHLVRTSQTKGAFGFSILAGGGLGVGVFTGEMVKWDGKENGRTSIERYEAGDPDDGLKRIPTVLPVLDINLGMRFNFGDRVALRVEGGFHNMFYSGASLGVMF